MLYDTICNLIALLQPQISDWTKEPIQITRSEFRENENINVNNIYAGIYDRSGNLLYIGIPSEANFSPIEAPKQRESCNTAQTMYADCHAVGIMPNVAYNDGLPQIHRLLQYIESWLVTCANSSKSPNEFKILIQKQYSNTTEVQKMEGVQNINSSLCVVRVDFRISFFWAADRCPVVPCSC